MSTLGDGMPREDREATDAPAARVPLAGIARAAMRGNVRRNDGRARGEPAYWAFVVHRVSGLALAVFLPFHFLALAQALDPARLDAFLAWTRQPAVHASEILLVTALAAHLAGGLRLLFIEFTGWHAPMQKNALALGAAFAVALGLALALA